MQKFLNVEAINLQPVASTSSGTRLADCRSASRPGTSVMFRRGGVVSTPQS